MPKVMRTQDALESLRLEDEATGAVVHLAPARGGMVSRFSVGGTDVLFLDESTLRDPSKSVRGGIPILFPIAGRLPGDRYEVNGRAYELKQHGFARNLPWTVVDPSTGDGAAVTLALEATSATRAVYPFEFALRFTYRLRAGALSLEQSFENRGDAPMPIRPGLHPYFFLPDAAKGAARVESDATRAFDNVAGREIAAPRRIALGGREVDLFLLDHHPRQTTLHRPGLPPVRLSFGADQEVLVVWTLPGRDFVCVEPWRARSGAFATGATPTVAPRSAVSTTLRIELV